MDKIFLLYLALLLPVIAVAATRQARAEWLALGHLAAVVAVFSMRDVPGFRLAYDWYPVALPLFTFPEAAYLCRLVLPGWHDASLLRFETRLFSTPATLWFAARQSVWLSEIFSAGYLSFYMYAILVGGLLYFGTRADRPRFERMLAAMALAYVACYAIYILWPIEGPRYTLPVMDIGGGRLTALVRAFQHDAGVHGNAFPSAHAAMGALAIFYLRRRSPLGAVVLAFFVVLMCFGAVYLQYHYASDMVAGLVVGALATALVEVLSRQPA